MALGLWESRAGQEIAASIKRAKEDAEKQRISAYETAENYYLGNTKSYLIRHVAEGNNAWFERSARYVDFGLTGVITDAIVSALWGKDIGRTISDDPESREQVAFDEVYAQSRWAAHQRAVGKHQVLLGDAFALVHWSDRLKRLLMHPVDPANVFVEPHPDDCMTALTVVERRIDPNDEKKEPMYWVWKEVEYCLVDANGRFLDPGTGVADWNANPYGVIPYAHLRGLPLPGSYWGASVVRGCMEFHREINQEASQHGRMITMQAHSQLVVSDHGAEDKLKTGESNAIILSAEGRAEYLAPNANFEAVLKSIETMYAHAFDVSRIPQSVIRGGSAASGYALTVERQMMAELIADLSVEGEAFEQELAKLVCVIGSASGLPLPPDPVVTIDMSRAVVPADKDAEFERDLLLFSSGLLTKEKMVERYVPEVADEDRAQYLAELEAEKAVRMSTGLAAFAADAGNSGVPAGPGGAKA